MSGDLQARRKSNKNRSKKKSQLQEMEKREYFEEALLGWTRLIPADDHVTSNY